MDLSIVSEDRKEVLRKIDEYERKGWFDKDVENDPPSPELRPEDVDYLGKKLSSKIKTAIANKMGRKFFEKMIKEGAVVIDGMEGGENLRLLKDTGAVITCNHFGIPDNYILYHCIQKSLKKKRLYKVIREGNYTGFSGLFGFLFRNCNTLPLSSNRRTMVNFMSAADTLLRRGEAVLIYPEQGMWWNYRKPRPFKIGAFKIAVRAGVPVLPTFITMKDDETKLDEHNYPLQHYTLHVMPPVYPDKTLSEKQAAEKMKEDTFALYKAKYEEVYGVPLAYHEEENAEETKTGGNEDKCCLCG
jgi:putative phospho-beta-glycosidase